MNSEIVKSSENAMLAQRIVMELEDDGTVVYSRSHNVPAGEEWILGREGLNFFDEHSGFEDPAACRRHFQSFLKSNKAAQSFIWRTSTPRGISDTRVLMTREYKTDVYNRSALVMLEIKSC